MKILRASDYKRMPWKNGKGETAEIAVFPAGAGLDDFDCRISMASVVEDGAFSTFRDIDRTLVVLTGEGIILAVEGSTPVELEKHSAPHSFAADVPTFATLLDGPITDLNIMARRGIAVCHVKRQTAAPIKASDIGMTLVFMLDPCTGSGLDPLASKDCVILDPGELLQLNEDENAKVILIEIVNETTTYRL